MKARHRRFAWIAAGVAVLGVAVALVLNAFQSNLVFFFTPTQVAQKEAPQGRLVGGRSRATTAAAERHQGVEGEAAGLGQLGLGHLGAGQHRQDRVDAQVVAQQ